MTLNVEGVVDGGVNGQKSLSRSGGFEPLHAPLPLPDRKMRVLGSIVLSEALGVLGRHTDLMQTNPSSSWMSQRERDPVLGSPFCCYISGTLPSLPRAL